jgi:hypothetical protein
MIDLRGLSLGGLIDNAGNCVKAADPDTAQ